MSGKQLDQPALYEEAGRHLKARGRLAKKLREREEAKKREEEAAKTPEEREAEVREAAELARKAMDEIQLEDKEEKNEGQGIAITNKSAPQIENDGPATMDAETKKNIAATLSTGLANKVKVFASLEGQKRELTEADFHGTATLMFNKCRNCEFTITSLCTKIYIERCTRCIFRLNGKIITNVVEVNRVQELNVVINTRVGCFWVENSKRVNVVYTKREYFVFGNDLKSYVLWCGCFMLRVQVADQLKRCDFGLYKKLDPTASVERTQFKIWWVAGKLMCDKVCRLKNGYPTTARESSNYDRKQDANVTQIADRMGITIRRGKDKIGKRIKPNEKCPCGSNKKDKKCCWA